MVTHWNVDRAGMVRALQELKSVAGKQKGQVA
jgi:hypothetical protein